MRDPYDSGEFGLYTVHDHRTRQQARLLVASRAQDAKDCHDLLRTLDLIDPNAPGVIRQCPRCGTPHQRWGSGARSRFCSAGCADTPPDGA